VLECVVWAGTGVLWTVSGGVPHSVGLIGDALAAEPTGFTFMCAAFLTPTADLYELPPWKIL
jgi:hypothetical protein